MKQITIIYPSTFKEFAGSLKQCFKWIKAPKRTTHNNKVMAELDRDICNLLCSGYWDNDISPTMRKRLAGGLPNGELSGLVISARRKLK